MVDPQALLKDLRRQVASLEDDLRERSEAPDEPFDADLRAEYAEAREAGRTAAGYQTWRDERVTQAAVAWVLATVFVRFCEDNELIAEPFLAGPGDRLAEAEERHEAFFKANAALNNRDWLIAAFGHLESANPVMAGLFDRRHNPLWELTPSYEAASALIAFWRRRGPDGEIVHDLTDPELGTRFLGDLYQDLSEHARKTYALLQTPDFVEEFILDLTLTPALTEFGLPGLRTIDPACGSGHFLLGIFTRLYAAWRDREPGTDPWQLVRRALDSVHGCDKNPFAVSIARFRLLVAAMRAGGEARLDKVPEFPINVAVGDSLLHGRGAPGIQEELFPTGTQHTYRTEDIADYVKSCDLLGRSTYHVVVGNPPYITVKDKQENDNYRKRYRSCHGRYVLSVPFAERLFQLAVRRSGSDRNAGIVGQITANSFAKREFGEKLVERFFPMVHLTHIIDTSGARIPGHGTPTMILVGRNHISREADPIRGVLKIRDEPPGRLDDPAGGKVWLAITRQLNKPGSESEWVSVEDVPRIRFSTHPWSLSGGGAKELLEMVESGACAKLKSRTMSIGITSVTGEDDLYLLPPNGAETRLRVSRTKPLVTGDVVRDYAAVPEFDAIWTYDADLNVLSLDELGSTNELFFEYRAAISARKRFGVPMLERGMAWHEWQELYASKLGTPLSIVFAEVTTHNHFVLDRGGKVFNRTAPVIKLPVGASERDHLGLVGVLNSSTACFWLKQACFPKGGSGMGRGIQPEAWMDRYAFNSSNVEDFPLPRMLPLHLGTALDSLARELLGHEPSRAGGAGALGREQLDERRAGYERIRGRMIALQEELDWRVYASYELLSEAEVGQLTAVETAEVPEVALGERAFEIVLARRIEAGEVETAWFSRHGSTPITEVPGRWPEWYRQIVKARIETIERRWDIALIERPECKRRWATESWEKKEERALRTWLLDRCERSELWFEMRDGVRHPRTLTVNGLADLLRRDEEVAAVAGLYAAAHLGRPDATLAQVLAEITANEHVPYLAALRYRDSGLRKRARWERVWELQREEDATGKRLDIEPPPKYANADFRRQSYWSQRGKLDVPKERFVSYPGASPDADDTMLLGWAGWDHRDKVQALVNVVNDRADDAGWGVERIVPLLAGIEELMPWVRQWHSGYDAEWQGDPAQEYQVYLDEQRGRWRVTVEELRGWRPVAPAGRGRRRAEGASGR